MGSKEEGKLLRKIYDTLYTLNSMNLKHDYVQAKRIITNLRAEIRSLKTEWLAWKRKSQSVTTKS